MVKPTIETPPDHALGLSPVTFQVNMNDPKPYGIRKTMTFESADDDHSYHTLGKPETKPRVDLFGVLAVVGSLLCFTTACISVSPWTTTPWKLGLKRQLQVVGLLLSVMNQALLLVIPKFFLILEARYGKSRIQNFEAILRNSGFMSQTHFAWRVAILSLIIFPIGLSLLYKEFQQGTHSISGGSSLINKSPNPINYYGLGSPAQLNNPKARTIGTSLMSNATLPFILATQNDPDLPMFPKAYGFNNLLLNTTSAAALDGPMPDYISSIQTALNVDETIYLSANVNATVTTYNNTIEKRRGENNFWLYYLDKVPTDDLASAETVSAMYNKYSFVLLINDLGDMDTSFCFIAFIPMAVDDHNTPLTTDQKQAAFQNNALLFDTHRAFCNGKWRITYNSISIVDGSCGPVLPESAQKIFTNATFAMSQYFLPSLVEYLGSFSDSRDKSWWIIPSFSTVLANMYWARATTLKSYSTWGDNKTVFIDPDTNATQRSNIYYQSDDHLTWERPTMNTSLILYFVFAIQPILTIFIFLADILLYRTPIGRGFGLVSFLAGVRVDNLKLLEGASFSGTLKKPLTVKITATDPPRRMKKGAQHPKVEYVLDSKTRRGSWPNRTGSLLKAIPLSSPFNRRLRRETAYEMIDS